MTCDQLPTNEDGMWSCKCGQYEYIWVPYLISSTHWVGATSDWRDFVLRGIALYKFDRATLEKGNILSDILIVLPDDVYLYILFLAFNVTNEEMMFSFNVTEENLNNFKKWSKMYNCLKK